MPDYEIEKIRVEVVVWIGDHTLRFQETGEARGAYYRGERAPDHYANSILEKNIRGTVDTCAAKAVKSANAFVARAYPVAGE